MHRIIYHHPLNGIQLSFRVGIHAGDVVSGIIGKSKFCFDIWGVCPGRLHRTKQCPHPQADEHQQSMSKESASRAVRLGRTGVERW